VDDLALALLPGPVIGKERVILTRGGRRLAAIIPPDQLEKLQATEARAAKKPRRTKQSLPRPVFGF